MHEQDLVLLAEIQEISDLIEAWDSTQEPEVEWAVTLLQRVLAKRMRQLSPTIH